MWKDIITLRAETTALDEFNRPYKVFVDKVVQAQRKSVKFTEFYQAAATGLKAEVIFEVRSYDGQTYVLYKDIQYRIIRSFEKYDTVELTCTPILNESEYVQ